MIIVSEEDFKAQKLSEWGFKKSEYKLGKIDIKLQSIWIEAKQKDEDIYEMLAQILFTAEREKKKGMDLPTTFGCFNSKKGALIDSYAAHEVFVYTDINWAQTPSNIDKKTVETIKYILKEVKEYTLDDFGKELKAINERGFLEKKQITQNNFINVYNEWLLAVGNFLDEEIRPDCYLADLMTDGKKTIAEKLRVVLKKEDEDYYYKARETERLFEEIKIENQQKYKNFWAKYARPPQEEYQDYILSRRDLLQPHNIREVKGAFFTPQVWAEKSKEYLAKAFGENWQDEYYIWDCACGTGNLEAGLINQDRVFMSTLDNEDLLIMKDRQMFANATHFQFDFLNDDWKQVSEGGKIPNKLWDVIKNEPQKLIIYINPPYLEVGNRKESYGGDKARTAATQNVLKQIMLDNNLGKESNELFMQFYHRIYTKIPNCKIGSFSKLKNCCAPNFENWRKQFKAKFCGGFVCRANTFDNVNGKFPISFQVWDCEIKHNFKEKLKFDVLENDGIFECIKTVYSLSSKKLINSWFKSGIKLDAIGFLTKNATDFQNQNYVAIYSKPTKGHYNSKIAKSNLIETLIYVSVRLCIKATWINDRDQFLKPKIKPQTKNEIFDHKTEYLYESDQNFINNCIVFALFEKNFTTWQIFENSDIGLTGVSRDMEINKLLIKNRIFSKEATAVLDIAKKIYKLYYANFDYAENTGWEDVRKALKNDKISQFDELWQDFKNAKDDLADSLVTPVYEYGFLLL